MDLHYRDNEEDARGLPPPWPKQPPAITTAVRLVADGKPPMPAEASSELGADDGPATGRVVPPQERRERIERVVYGVLAMVVLAIGAGALISTWHKARDPGAVVVPALAASRVTT